MINKKDRAGYLLKNTSIFALSNIAMKLINFILVPLYTYCLSTSEYGVADLLFAISSVLVPVITLNIVEGIYRFSLDKDADNDKILSISFVLLIFASIIGLLIIPIMKRFLEFSSYNLLFYFYVITSAFSQVLLTNLKGQEKLKKFAIGNILSTIFVALFNILFLLIMKMKVEGYFLSYIISNVLVAIYSFIVGNVANNLKNFNFDKKLFNKMTKYSIVLIPTSFMWWIMNSSDRIMISEFINSSANGIYAISYKLPSILTVISNIFNQAWMFSAVDLEDSEDNEKYNNKIFELLLSVLLIASVTLLILTKPFLKIYVSSEYYSSWKYVPYLILGSTFSVLGTFVATQYSVKKDSKGFLFSGLFGAILNIILNFILIPKIGVHGAAFATCVSYISTFIYRIIDTRKYIKINMKFKYFIAFLLLTISCITTYIEGNIGIICKIVELIIVIICFKNDYIQIFNLIQGRLLDKFRIRKDKTENEK